MHKTLFLGGSTVFLFYVKIFFLFLFQCCVLFIYFNFVQMQVGLSEYEEAH